MDPINEGGNANGAEANQGMTAEQEEMLVEEFAQFWFESELIDDVLEDVNED